MRGNLVGIFTFTLIAALILVPAAQATKPVLLIADIVDVVNVVTGVEVVNDDIAIITVTSTQQMEGGWVGVFVNEVKIVTKANGPDTAQALGVFTGTILGKTGTLTIRNLGAFGSGTPFTARGTILSGTGDFANLRGTVTVSFTGPTTAELVSSLHVDP